MLKEPEFTDPLGASQEEAAVRPTWCTGFLPGLEPAGLPAPTWMGVNWNETSLPLPADRSPGWLRNANMAFHPYEWDVGLVLLGGLDEENLKEHLTQSPAFLKASSVAGGGVAWWWLGSGEFAVAGFDRGSEAPFQRWVNGLGQTLGCRQQPVFSQELVCMDRLMLEGEKTLAVLGRMLQAGWSSRHVELLCGVTAVGVTDPEKGQHRSTSAVGSVLSGKH